MWILIIHLATNGFGDSRAMAFGYRSLAACQAEGRAQLAHPYRIDTPTLRITGTTLKAVAWECHSSQESQ